MTRADARHVYETEDPLTPREARLNRTAAWLRWGAILNTLLGLGILVLTLAGSAAGSALPAFLADALISRFDNVTAFDKDAALLAALLLMVSNIALMLLVIVGSQAQELWSLLVIGVALVLNAFWLVVFGFLPALVTLGFGAWAGYRLAQDSPAFRTNPVMLKELRERMRGARAFVVITIYLALMSGFAVLMYLIQRVDVQNTGIVVTGELGRDLFAGVVGIELLLIIFIAPSFTAGAVTAERERKTYDLLQITLLSRASFIIGKLESALSYILLLLLAAIPLQSIAFLFGGVSEMELVLAFLILAVTAITLGALGLYFSTAVDRTLTASIRTYTAAFAVIIGIPLLFSYVIAFFTGALVGTGSNFTSSSLLETVMIYAGAFLVSLNPVATALATRQLLVERQTIGFWTATLSSNGSSIPMVSPWITFVVIYLIVSALLVMLSVRRMRRVEG